MKNCKKMKKLMTLYIDDRLDDSVRKEYEAHIKDCILCRKELEDMLEIVSLCREIPQVGLPENFRKELHEKLVQEKENHTKKITLLGRKYIKIGVTIAAGLLLVVVMRGIFGNMLFNSPQNTKNDIGLQEESVGAVQKAMESDSIQTESSKKFDAESNKESFGIASIEEEPEISSFANESKHSKRNGYDTVRKIEDTRIIINLEENNIDYKQQIDKIKDIARENGVEFYEGRKKEEKQLINNSFKLIFNLPNNSYERFINQLTKGIEKASLKVIPMSEDELSSVVNQINLTLENLNKEIERQENSSSITNPEEFEHMLLEREYLKSELKKVQNDSEFTSILIEISK